MRITIRQLRTLIKESMQTVSPVPEPDCKSFAVFDFDETLALTKSEILVVDDHGKKIRSLTPAQFAMYIPAADEKFDFSEFDIVKDGKPTVLMDVLHDMVACGADSAAILTARGPKSEGSIRSFLADMGIKLQIIDTLGSAEPQKKALKIKGYVMSYRPEFLHFFEDSPGNLLAVKKMAETDREFERVTVILHKMVAGNKAGVEQVEYIGPKSTSAVEDSNFS